MYISPLNIPTNLQNPKNIALLGTLWAAAPWGTGPYPRILERKPKYLCNTDSDPYTMHMRVASTQVVREPVSHDELLFISLVLKLSSAWNFSAGREAFCIYWKG